MRRSRRILGVTLAASVAVLLVAAPAAAHVEPDPSEVDPGEQVTVEFTAEHGCDDAPTTGMVFRVPKGVRDAEPVEQDEFTGSAKRHRITFSGGAVPADEEATVAITFTAPDRHRQLVWKVVQRCEEGVERWIERDPDGDTPAPRVGVGEPAKAGHDDDPGGDAHEH